MTEVMTQGRYINPEAPIDYGVGRRCTMPLSKCETARQFAEQGFPPEVGKVNRYVEPYMLDDNGQPLLLLCEQCEKKRLEDDVEPWQLQGVRVHGRKVSYILPYLQVYRLRKAWGISDLARAANCSRDTIKSAESKRKMVSTQMCASLARALGVSVDQLRGTDG